MVLLRHIIQIVIDNALCKHISRAEVVHEVLVQVEAIGRRLRSHQVHRQIVRQCFLPLEALKHALIRAQWERFIVGYVQRVVAYFTPIRFRAVRAEERARLPLAFLVTLRERCLDGRAGQIVLCFWLVGQSLLRRKHMHLRGRHRPARRPGLEVRHPHRLL